MFLTFSHISCTKEQNSDCSVEDILRTLVVLPLECKRKSGGKGERATYTYQLPHAINYWEKHLYLNSVDGEMVWVKGQLISLIEFEFKPKRTIKLFYTI